MNTPLTHRLLSLALAACMSLMVLAGIDSLAGVERAPTALLSAKTTAPRV